METKNIEIHNMAIKMCWNITKAKTKEDAVSFLIILNSSDI